MNSLEASVEAEVENSSPTDEGNENGAENKSNAITNVESEVPTTADAAFALRKLKQFQRFYILVVVYIYFTRIVVYLFATTLGYRQTWLRYFVTELGTLVFYAVVGILFRPMEDNPYLATRATDVEIEFA